MFALLRYDITDTVSVSGGIRYIDEKKTFHTQYNSIVGPGTYGTQAWFDSPLVLPRFTKSGSWDDYMGEATVDWQATEDSLIYARWSRGFRSGGYSMRQAASETLTPTKVAALNAQGFSLVPQAHATEGADYGNFEPEITELFEIGSKNVLMDGALQINGCLLYTSPNPRD